MCNIFCVFLYFIVNSNSFTNKNIFIQKWRLNTSLSPPSTQSSPDENVYEKDPVSVSYEKRKKRLDGYDARTIINDNTKKEIKYSDEETIKKIKENYDKKQLLDKLENPQISILQKLYLLSMYQSEICPTSINIDTLEW